MKNKPTSYVNIVGVVWTIFHHHHILQYHLHCPPDTYLGHKSNKQKSTHLNQIDSSGNVSNDQDTHNQIDLFLANGLSK